MCRVGDAVVMVEEVEVVVVVLEEEERGKEEEVVLVVEWAGSAGEVVAVVGVQERKREVIPPRPVSRAPASLPSTPLVHPPAHPQRRRRLRRKRGCR